MLEKKSGFGALVKAKPPHVVLAYKKTSLRESLAKSRAYNPIRDFGETLGEREKSRQESSRDSLGDSR